MVVCTSDCFARCAEKRSNVDSDVGKGVCVIADIPGLASDVCLTSEGAIPLK